jgi:hypothetical protein
VCGVCGVCVCGVCVCGVCVVCVWCVCVVCVCVCVLCVVCVCGMCVCVGRQLDGCMYVFVCVSFVIMSFECIWRTVVWIPLL